MATNGLSVVIARLKSEAPNQEEVLLPDDPLSVFLYDDYVELNTVGKVSTSRDQVYDEGDNRIIYHDITVSMEAVLTDDMSFGPYIDGTPSDNFTFNERLERIDQFLSKQGLGINYNKFPTSVRRIVPTDENRDGTTTYTGYHGWLYDNFNGPKPLGLTLEPIAGTEAVLLVWKVKFRTFQTDYDSVSTPIIPKISSELRMDIGIDGDLEIVVDGTIYGDSLAAIYAARDYLEVTYMPNAVSGISASHVSTWEEDKWAMVNGFTKDVTFNIEKNGRSAKFTIRYKQVKSNNAYPLGIRDIEFKQKIKSSLLNTNPMSGSGFMSWKNTFKGKITIPPRMTAEYAWYIFHLLVQQQLRHSTLEPDSTAKNNDGNEAKNQEANKKIKQFTTYCRAIPLELEIDHSHFARTINFQLVYLLIAPLSKIMTASCILKRVNNDFQKSLSNPQEKYTPIPISQQWYAWNRSVDIGQGFDPTQPDAQNPGTLGRPHRDTAGTEVFETGHNYRPFSGSEDQQDKQRTLLISTTFDPNEEDPDYRKESSGNYEDYPYKESNVPGLDSLKDKSDIEKNEGEKAKLPFIKSILQRLLVDITPEKSWVKYNQEYEIIETNPTVPTESVADISASDFQNENLYVRYKLGDPDFSPNSDQDYEYGATQPSKEIGAKFAGRETTPELDPDGNASEDAHTRRTYAHRPSRFYIRVKGTAIRSKYKIPMPSLVSIAGEKAVRVGTGRFNHKSIGGDADTPVYMAMWDQVYTVDKPINSEDILDNIEDTGASMLYV